MTLEWNQLSFYGHRYWQDGTARTKKIMDFQVNGPSPQRRSRLKQCDVAKENLLKRGIKIKMPNSRQEWRKVIEPQSAQLMEL